MRSVILPFPPVFQKIPPADPAGSRISKDQSSKGEIDSAVKLIYSSSSTPSLSGLKYFGASRTFSTGGIAFTKKAGVETCSSSPLR